jgi:hypothetical protein
MQLVEVFMAEPPYGVIWNQLKAGKVIPFLGAGASMVGRPQGAQWDPNNPQFLPSGRELSHLLADEASFPSQEDHDKDDLAKVASYYAVVSGRQYLRERLHEVLSHTFTIGPLHAYLASIPTPLLIVTTNYDTLIEQAFQAAGKKYDLVIHPPSERKDIGNAIWWWPDGANEPTVVAPNELDLDLSQKDRNTIIYKMHGTVQHDTANWDSFVITEEDYVDFLSRMTIKTAIPAVFYNYFRTRSFLFLGYGLGDWNLRVILKNLDGYLKNRVQDGNEEVLPSWAIQLKPSELERRLWEKRNVNIFDMTHDDFVTKMKQKG